MKKILCLVLIPILIAACATGCGGQVRAKGVKVIEVPLTQEEFAFGVDPSQPELLAQVNAFIDQMLIDGTYDKIYNQYFGGGEPQPVHSFPRDREKDQLVVATNAMFRPFEYVQGDQYYGIDMEIAAALAAYLGKELVIVDMDFEAVCLSVGQGKCDIAMAGLTIKPDRMEHVNFSKPYYEASQVLVVRDTDSTFDLCEDALHVEALLRQMDKKTKIGVQSGTTAQYFLQGDEDWGFTGYDLRCVGYNAAALALQDMLNGNIDYVLMDWAPALSIAQAMNQWK